MKIVISFATSLGRYWNLDVFGPTQCYITYFLLYTNQGYSCQQYLTSVPRGQREILAKIIPSAPTGKFRQNKSSGSNEKFYNNGCYRFWWNLKPCLRLTPSRTLQKLLRSVRGGGGRTFKNFKVPPPLGLSRSWPKKKKQPSLGQRNWPTALANTFLKKAFLEGFKKKKEANRFCWLANNFCWLTLWKSYSVHPFLDDYFWVLNYFLTIWPGLKKKKPSKLVGERIFFGWHKLTFSQKLALKKKTANREPTTPTKGKP